MSEPKKMGFSGGRENTPFAELVDSNYYAANHGEVCVKVSGICSVETLGAIVAWAKRETELVSDKRGDWRRVKVESK